VTKLRALGAAAAVIGLAVFLTGCGAATPTPTPSPSPSPSPTLGLGVLPLGGVVASAGRLSGPYASKAGLLKVPASVEAARVPASPTTALSELVTALDVPGPPINTGDGLAYNLGATSGYQLTSAPDLLSFNFHPNTPVDETGATPSVATAEQFAEQFLTEHKVPGAGGGLLTLPQLSSANAADRVVYFQWTEDGYPVVNILGQPEEVDANVAANYAEKLSLVGITGQVPSMISGSAVQYPSLSVKQVVHDLNLNFINPNSYLLQSSDLPFPSPQAVGTPDPVEALLTAASLAVVNSAGYAVPVLLFQVANRAPTTQFVTCAATTYACAPLRYNLPTPSPTPSG
jgi:hypothetical protein